VRAGIGYDVHRLEPGRRLVLGGVEIPHPLGLTGHSDADVLLHAIADALLGAAALGDIGQHFPPGDPSYLDASSLALLEEVRRLVEIAGYRVGNIDASVVAEAPRLAPHIPLMRERIAAATGVAPDRIGIKATTNEGLGFTGRGEGIAAWAIALIEEIKQGEQ
jgi:2-C-methyl-D-erythritol 2,4-cyclodiphosphate synthase